MPKPAYLFLMMKGLKFPKEVAGEILELIPRVKNPPGLWILCPVKGCCWFPAFRRWSSSPQDCFCSLFDFPIPVSNLSAPAARPCCAQLFHSPWFSDSSHLNPQTPPSFALWSSYHRLKLKAVSGATLCHRGADLWGCHFLWGLQ